MELVVHGTRVHSLPVHHAAGQSPTRECSNFDFGLTTHVRPPRSALRRSPPALKNGERGSHRAGLAPARPWYIYNLWLSSNEIMEAPLRSIPTRLLPRHSLLSSRARRLQLSPPSVSPLFLYSITVVVTRAPHHFPPPRAQHLLPAPPLSSGTFHGARDAGHHVAAPRRPRISPGAGPRARRCPAGLLAERPAPAARGRRLRLVLAAVPASRLRRRRRRGRVQPHHVAPLRWDNRCALHARILLSLPPPPKWDHPTPWSRCVRVNARTPCCPTSNREEHTQSARRKEEGHTYHFTNLCHSTRLEMSFFISSM